MESVWSQIANMPSYACLKENIQTETLIIGGGMAGILCAYMLEQAGVPYVLVEANRICSGITKNTTAKITSQHGLIFQKLIQQFGVEKAQKYLCINELAIKKYHEFCKEKDCDFKVKDSFVYCLDDVRKIEKELVALEKIGFEAEFVDKIPLPFSIAGAVKFKNQAEFNPLKFIAEIAKGLHIYEHTNVCELIGTKAITNYGEIEANQVIVTTHFPFLNKHGSYFLKMYQSRSYVIALENAKNVQGMYVDEAQKGMSFRNYEDLLLIGGGDHRTGKKGGGWQELRDFAKKYYPNSREKYHWATQDCMTLDMVPYIGEYSSNTTDLYVATGFNKWGMTSSMVAAMLLSDMVQGKETPYTDVFSPSRSILRPQLALNTLEAIMNLLTPTTKRCPHMGCALKWNELEHSWDCPCHGSRFSKNGDLIDNPATGDLKKKKEDK